jgi:hypothetical protein
METLLALQSATRAGLYQVQRVTLRPGRAADVLPLTEWLALPAALAALDRVEG